MIKQVGETAINPIHKSTCHCGAVELEVQLPDGIVDPRGGSDEAELPHGLVRSGDRARP